MSISANFPTSVPSLSLNFVNSGQLDPRVTFSRASGATWFNSAGVLVGVDFSSTSLTVGTGWQTLTLSATAGVDRNWIVGAPVQLIASTGTNTMTGVVVSYTASTQTLVVSVASFVGSGTYSTWRVSNLSPRFDYDPATLVARGFLIEEARTNSIRNNTMQGAVAGTPGTLPTNWVQSALASGLTANVLGTGTSSGINYIDIRISGTTADTTGWSVFTDANTQIAASSGQVWTGSLYVAIIGGSTANIAAGRVRVVERNSGGSYITESNTSWATATSVLTNNRFSVVSTLGGTAAFVQFGVYFQANSGDAIDITLRIGLPQLELGAFATSVIPTTTTALTRSADVASVNTLSPWFNATEGTLYAEGTVGYTVPGTKFPMLASLNDGTGNNRIDVGYLTAAASALEVTAGGVPQVGMYPLATSATRKVAGAYKLDDFAVSVNGSSPQTDPTGTVPVLDRLRLGDRTGLTNNILSGWVRRVVYYPRKLSSAELQAITA